jgi:hypothetical protein
MKARKSRIGASGRPVSEGAGAGGGGEGVRLAPEQHMDLIWTATIIGVTSYCRWIVDPRPNCIHHVPTHTLCAAQLVFTHPAEPAAYQIIALNDCIQMSSDCRPSHALFTGTLHQMMRLKGQQTQGMACLLANRRAQICSSCWQSLSSSTARPTSDTVAS